MCILPIRPYSNSYNQVGLEMAAYKVMPSLTQILFLSYTLVKLLLQDLYLVLHLLQLLLLFPQSCHCHVQLRLRRAHQMEESI